jgi:hypothetical protein
MEDLLLVLHFYATINAMDMELVLEIKSAVVIKVFL